MANSPLAIEMALIDQILLLETLTPVGEVEWPASVARCSIDGRVAALARIESGRLALPDVLAAGARHRLRGMFLCHRLPADGTILTPHTGPAFCSTNRLRAGGNVKLIDHGVEFFQLLHCCEKLERFSISGYRPG